MNEGRLIGKVSILGYSADGASWRQVERAASDSAAVYGHLAGMDIAADMGAMAVTDRWRRTLTARSESGTRAWRRPASGHT